MVYRQTCFGGILNSNQEVALPQLGVQAFFDLDGMFMVGKLAQCMKVLLLIDDGLGSGVLTFFGISNSCKMLSSSGMVSFVRILKNVRSKMVDGGLRSKGFWSFLPELVK